MTTIIPIPAFRDNYIWAVRNGRTAAVVDPGDAAPVLDYLDANGSSSSAILATHHHGDHVGGVAALCARYDVPVFGPARETIPGRTHALARRRPRRSCRARRSRSRCWTFPGHTAGHIAYCGAGADPLLFCGDTLFAGGCGRLFEGTPEQMWPRCQAAALPARDARLLRTRIHAGEHPLRQSGRARQPGLGARIAPRASKRERDQPTLPTTVGEELATNPFLRAALPHVMASAAAQRAVPIDRASSILFDAAHLEKRLPVTRLLRTHRLTVAAGPAYHRRNFARSPATQPCNLKCDIDDP